MINHWVLLPGMDGTGELFRPLRAAVPEGVLTTVVPYPHELPLEDLVPYVRAKLPMDPFILIAESFGGLVAAPIAADPPDAMKALVLSASFAASPANPFLSALHWAAVPFLFKVQPPAWALNLFLTGRRSAELQQLLIEARMKADPVAMAARLKEILRSDATAHYRRSNVPLLYLLASQDRLVTSRSLEALRKVRPDLCMKTIEASHLLLQVAPQAAVGAILGFLESEVTPAH